MENTSLSIKTKFPSACLKLKQCLKKNVCQIKKKDWLLEMLDIIQYSRSKLSLAAWTTVWRQSAVFLRTISLLGSRSNENSSLWVLPKAKHKSTLFLGRHTAAALLSVLWAPQTKICSSTLYQDKDRYLKTQTDFHSQILSSIYSL